MKKEKPTWKDRPTIINKIPEDDTLLFFIDESGEGTLRKINQAFVEKDENKEFSQRHDIYILNGITITGKNYYYLQNNLNKIKRKLYENIKAVYFRKKWTQLKNGKCITTSGIELADLTISPIRRILHAEYLIIESKFLQYPFYRNRGLSFIE